MQAIATLTIAMNKSFILIVSLLSFFLSACSTQPVVQSQDVQPEVESYQIADEEAESGISLPAPDLYRVKDGKTLKLIKLMEGGACKNDSEGVVGMFMLYADPDDIERIKQQQGNGVFADFEEGIEELAMLALQQAIEELDFNEDPFAIDDEDIQRKQAEALMPLFKDSVTGSLVEFENETTLTIDLLPMQNSLYFYLDGCELPHEH